MDTIEQTVSKMTLEEFKKYMLSNFAPNFSDFKYHWSDEIVEEVFKYLKTLDPSSPTYNILLNALLMIDEKDKKSFHNELFSIMFETTKNPDFLSDDIKEIFVF